MPIILAGIVLIHIFLLNIPLSIIEIEVLISRMNTEPRQWLIFVANFAGTAAAYLLSLLLLIYMIDTTSYLSGNFSSPLSNYIFFLASFIIYSLSMILCRAPFFYYSIPVAHRPKFPFRKLWAVLLISPVLILLLIFLFFLIAVTFG